MTKKKLSPAQTKALEAARADASTSLRRHQGGFWVPSAKPFDIRAVEREWYGTQTVRSLVALGLLRETEHRSTGDGRSKFCVLVSVVQQPTTQPTKTKL